MATRKGARARGDGKPEGEVRVLVLLLPAQPKDCLLTVGKALSGRSSFELRSRQLRQSAPWAVPAPYFARGLTGLFKPAPY